MPSNQTPNYQLSQWEKDDKILMDDFNADNTKIDGALKAEADAREALAATIPKIAVGSYTGDGAAERFLDLGFTPKAVYISTNYGVTFTNNVNYANYLGGLIFSGGPLEVSGTIYGQIMAGGVQLYHKKDSSHTYSTNRENTKYYYFAVSW